MKEKLKKLYSYETNCMISLKKCPNFKQKIHKLPDGNGTLIPFKICPLSIYTLNIYTGDRVAAIRVYWYSCTDAVRALKKIKIPCLPLLKAYMKALF